MYINYSPHSKLDMIMDSFCLTNNSMIKISFSDSLILSCLISMYPGICRLSQSCDTPSRLEAQLPHEKLSKIQ